MVLSDFTQPPSTLLVNLINNDNGTTLPGDGLFYSAPKALTEGRYNTEVSVSAKPESFQKGSIKVAYNRVDMDFVLGGRDVTFDIGEATTYAEVIPAINAAFSLNLQANDYIDGPLPLEANGSIRKIILLVANPLSYIWMGQVYLNSEGGAKPTLSSIITVSNLSGFQYPYDTNLGSILPVQLLNGFTYSPDGSLTALLEQNELSGFDFSIELM